MSLPFDNRYPRIYLSKDEPTQKVSVYEWNESGVVTVGWHVGPGATWREAEFSPEEARQIALCILSRPCVVSLSPSQSSTAQSTEGAEHDQ